MVHLLEQKKIIPTLQKITEIQIINFAWLNDINITNSQVKVASYIAINGYDKSTLQNIVDLGIFKSVQCVANCRRKLVQLGILIEPSNRVYKINPNLGVFNGSIQFKLNLLYVNKD